MLDFFNLLKDFDPLFSQSNVEIKFDDFYLIGTQSYDLDIENKTLIVNFIESIDLSIFNFLINYYTSDELYKYKISDKVITLDYFDNKANKLKSITLKNCSLQSPPTIKQDFSLTNVLVTHRAVFKYVTLKIE